MSKAKETTSAGTEGTALMQKMGVGCCTGCRCLNSLNSSFSSIF